MLLKEKITANRVINLTYKNFFFALIDCTAAYIFNEFILNHFFDFPVFIPTILGTALAFFIGFNNNQAYDRWWEARKIWGSIVNNSRTFARMIISFVDDKEDERINEIKNYMVKNHITFLYSLKKALRGVEDVNVYKFLSDRDWVKIKDHSNVPNALLLCQSDDLNYLYKNGYIDGFQFMQINEIITTFTDDMGKSERIKNTVFPTTYTFYAKFFIWVFIYCVTMALASMVGLWSILIGTLLGYVFFTIQALGQNLVNPFEKDNIMGIPLDSITRTIEINLLQMLNDEPIPSPTESVKGEYMM